MKQYEGELRTLGAARVYKTNVNYAFIEIGGHRLKNVGISPALNGILQLSLAGNQPITLWVTNNFGKNIICGVKRQDGVVFRKKMTGVVTGIAFAIFGGGALLAGNTLTGAVILAAGAYLLYKAVELRSIPADDVL